MILQIFLISRIWNICRDSRWHFDCNLFSNNIVAILFHIYLALPFRRICSLDKCLRMSLCLSSLHHLKILDSKIPKFRSGQGHLGSYSMTQYDSYSPKRSRNERPFENCLSFRIFSFKSRKLVLDFPSDFRFFDVG